MNVDYSVFYYTYSTIAQTLAGAFGFLGAVVLFQMQSINAGFEYKAAKLRGYVDHGKGIQYMMDEWIACGDWGKIADQLQVEGTVDVGDGEAGKIRTLAMNTRRAFLEDWTRLSALKRSMNLSLKLTGLTIIFSLVCMPLTNAHLISGLGMATFLLVCAVFLAIASLLSYLSIVSHVLK